MAYTEEELAGLTDEERAAMLEEDDEQEGDGDAGDDDQADDEAGDDEGDDDSGEDDADGGADAGEDDAGDDDSDGEEEEAQAPSAHAPILVADAPEKAEERLTEIAGEKKALRKQYDDGELTFDEYETKAEALDDERMDLKLALNTAQTAAKIAHQQEVNQREADINSFLADHNIKRDFGDLRFAALDNAVKLVASREENANLGVREILQKAHDECVAQGVLQPKKAGKQPEPQQQQQQQPKKPLKTVPTLAKVPASDLTGTDEGNRFAHLDRMDPVEREAALAKLSPADQEAYLQYA